MGGFLRHKKTYYEGRPESKDGLHAGVLLPERESLAGKILEHPAYVPYSHKRFSLSHWRDF
jgi:hypothetical protein